MIFIIIGFIAIIALIVFLTLALCQDSCNNVGIATFEKVSRAQFELDLNKIFGDKYLAKDVSSVYYSLHYPTRATSGSAGYDFYAPFGFELQPGESITIPTGIRAFIDDDYVLQLHTRSSLGFKYKLWLDNITGIIDSDYYYSDNEGHIILKLTNNSSDKVLTTTQGDKIAQGIFLQYGITTDDNATEKRNGGFGSTGK